ncbi:hypothetical protein AB6M97_08515 [Streptococcus hillyeri]|uniref:hypothetical protein n=2 Tax=Streptococcus hillyeri TaxID=2282420 RepID=UPI0026C88002
MKKMFNLFIIGIAMGIVLYSIWENLLGLVILAAVAIFGLKKLRDSGKAIEEVFIFED